MLDGVDGGGVGSERGEDPAVVAEHHAVPVTSEDVIVAVATQHDVVAVTERDAVVAAGDAGKGAHSVDGGAHGRELGKDVAVVAEHHAVTVTGEDVIVAVATQHDVVAIADRDAVIATADAGISRQHDHRGGVRSELHGELAVIAEHHVVTVTSS